jgi:glycosyltransferase involved in cell wall biosynthesis
LLYVSERLACRLASLVLLDTQTHAEYVARLFGIPEERIGAVLVGAEAHRFPRITRHRKLPGALKVLFYGQFIPLHGSSTVIEAARLSRDRNEAIDWLVIGVGQEAERIRRNLDADPIPSLTWLAWVPYAALVDQIRVSDVGLGIFGSSGKAGRVIPNKVFQILSSGLPLVTRDSAAILELLPERPPGVRLVPPEDPEALLRAIKELAESGERPSPEVAERFSSLARGRRYADLLTRLLTH